MTIRQRSLGLLTAASATVAVGLWLYEDPPSKAAPAKLSVSREGSPATLVQPRRASISNGEAKVRLQKIGQMPLYFIENRGQLDSRVAFYVQGRDKTIYFTKEGVTFGLIDAASEETDQNSRLHSTSQPEREETKSAGRWIVKLDFIGADPKVKISPGNKAAALVSYFKGPREQWKTGLPTYDRIVYSDLWPGIDLAYFDTSGHLNYHFFVRPGANPAQIRLAYRGASSVRVNDAGELEVQTPAGGFRDRKPGAEQEVEGSHVEISAAFALERGIADEARRYGFEVGSHDPSKVLVLSPGALDTSHIRGGLR